MCRPLCELLSTIRNLCNVVGELEVAKRGQASSYELLRTIADLGRGTPKKLANGRRRAEILSESCSLRAKIRRFWRSAG